MLHMDKPKNISTKPHIILHIAGAEEDRKCFVGSEPEKVQELCVSAPEILTTVL